MRELKVGAEAMGLQLQHLEIQAFKDIGPVFREASKGRADAILVLANPVLISQQAQFINLVTKSRIPAIYSQPEFVDAGGLISYTANFAE